MTAETYQTLPLLGTSSTTSTRRPRQSKGNFYTVLQNTVVDQNGRGSQDAITGILNFADEGIPEAAGMYVEGNIFHSAVALVRNYPGTALANTVTFNNNILPPGQTWTGLGSGNVSVDPVLADIQLVSPGAVGGAYNIPTPGPRDYQQLAPQIRAQFALGAGSPAKGTGPNGSDKGGVRALGVTLGGAPVGTTNATTASITVGTLMTGNSIPERSRHLSEWFGLDQLQVSTERRSMERRNTAHDPYQPVWADQRPEDARCRRQERCWILSGRSSIWHRRTGLERLVDR
jgi:hypothetical protein